MKYTFKKGAICLILFLIINILFFHQMFLGKVPLPLDHLVGALYPWHDYRMGYDAGVPVKNPTLSDAFSTNYPWRALAMDILKSGELPLWNIYQFSGTPLMANLQSAPFYPLNILMLVFGNLTGYSLMLFLQPLFSMVFMYLYLKEIKTGFFGAFLGGVIFAFSGFMLTYLELATASQVFLWTPLLLFILEKFFSTQKLLWLFLIPVIEFFYMSAGNFQIAFYVFVFTFIYALFSFFRRKSLFKRFYILGFIIGLFFCGLLLSAFQIFPTVELLNLSIRSTDVNIAYYNFGLIPLKNMITFLAPDFYGNPATYNFWGTLLGYQENSYYFGVISFVLLITSLFLKSKNCSDYYKLYLFIFVLSLLLIFDTPIGYSVYLLKIPILSTSYASRLILLLNFAAACMIAIRFEQVVEKRSQLIQMALMFLGFLVVLAIGLFVALKTGNLGTKTALNMQVGIKNLVVPIVFLMVFMSMVKYVKNLQLLKILVIGLVVLDLMRFGLKYTPFSPVSFAYPLTESISFLQKNIGNYRFERERTEFLPPDTWVPYKLLSPSGYDPLYSKSYANFYNVYNGVEPKEFSTRYAELTNYHSAFLDLVGVKYLIVGKRDSTGRIDKEATSTAIEFNQPRFEKVLDDRSSVILKNKGVHARVSFYDQVVVERQQSGALGQLLKGFDFKNKIILNEVPEVHLSKAGSDQATISSYLNNSVTIKAETTGQTILMLTDAYYPGWKASVNGQDTKIYQADGIFRAVVVPPGKSIVYFYYQPDSFSLGVKISLISLSVFFLLLITERRIGDLITSKVRVR